MSWKKILSRLPLTINVGKNKGGGQLDHGTNSTTLFTVYSPHVGQPLYFPSSPCRPSVSRKKMRVSSLFSPRPYNAMRFSIKQSSASVDFNGVVMCSVIKFRRNMACCTYICEISHFSGPAERLICFLRRTNREQRIR